MQINPQFLQWLESTPQALAKFADIVYEWYKMRGELPSETETSSLKEFCPGEEQELTAVGISHEDMDNLYQGYADAIVKEKAIEYVKGFIAGVMIAS